MSITINKAKQNIIHKINKALGEKIAQESDLVMPSDYNLGDFTYPCFILSKRLKKAPDVIATELSAKIKSCQTVKSVSATGPYLNFNLQPKKLMQVLEDINDNYGRHTFGKNKKIMVEFAQANTHKSFHIGHLRNIIVGESVCRILENAGYAVIRVNYQGDIGMHIAKCLWGITKLPTQLEQVLNSKDINAKVEFLAQAYVKGSGSFEKSQKIKKEIIEINNKIYASDNAIDSLYHQTRKWSLQYLDKIYKRLGVKFDRLYFESETFKPGKDMVEKGIKKNFFQISRDAVIFVGSKHGLHDRVFINSEGNATYEAKEMALAALQLAEFNPDLIIHVVGKEQTEYFKVVTKALEYVLPASKGREKHLDYGWVSLKGGKMSSRLGQVVLGEWLLNEVQKEIKKIMDANPDAKKDRQLAEQITTAVVKFAFLKTGINKDIIFDLQESVSLSGNSGPYVLYTYARIASILKKIKSFHMNNGKDKPVINDSERHLLLQLSMFPEVTQVATIKYDPSLIARYLFELCQTFNDYYHTTSVLKSQGTQQVFRVELIRAVAHVISRSVNLLGFAIVKKM